MGCISKNGESIQEQIRDMDPDLTTEQEELMLEQGREKDFESSCFVSCVGCEVEGKKEEFTELDNKGSGFWVCDQCKERGC